MEGEVCAAIYSCGRQAGRDFHERMKHILRENYKTIFLLPHERSKIDSTTSDKPE